MTSNSGAGVTLTVLRASRELLQLRIRCMGSFSRRINEVNDHLWYNRRTVTPGRSRTCISNLSTSTEYFLLETGVYMLDYPPCSLGGFSSPLTAFSTTRAGFIASRTLIICSHFSFAIGKKPRRKAYSDNETGNLISTTPLEIAGLVGLISGDPFSMHSNFEV